MDPLVVQVAALAGRVLVEAMVGPTWENVREALLRLYSRSGDKRAGEVALALDESRASVVESRSSPDVVAHRWQGRLEALLETQPDQMEPLRKVVAGALDQGPGAGVTTTVGGGQMIASNDGIGTVWV